eukprot:g27207.t1
MVSTGSQAEYFRPEQTIIIFDWDDTLCPSSWIRANKKVLSFFKPAPTTEKYQKPLRELQAAVEVLLKMSMKLGTVVIVTNAMDPWVDTWPHHGGQRAETSCRNFLPSLLPLVSTLPVIYARSIFEQQGVDMARSPSGSGPTRAMPGMKWKEVAFAQEIKDFYSRYQHQSWKNVISVGDSVFERDAVRRVVLQRPTPQKKCRTKTLKLFDDPEIDELVAQDGRGVFGFRFLGTDGDRMGWSSRFASTCWQLSKSLFSAWARLSQGWMSRTAV